MGDKIDWTVREGETHGGMIYQTRVRVEANNERFTYVLGDEPKLVSKNEDGRLNGKYFCLNHKTLKAAYEKALVDCPLAADVICCLLWDAARDIQTLHYLAKGEQETREEAAKHE